MKISRLCAVLSAGLCLCGCMVEETVESEAMKTLNENYYVVYRKVKNADVSLSTARDEIVFRSGEPALLELELSNEADTPVEIPEWYLLDPDNFLIHFRPYVSGETPMEAASAEWFMIAPDFDRPKPPDHYTLCLNPGNRARFSVPLDFIEKIPADRDMIFLAYAELNLSSISALSPMFVIVSEGTGTKEEK